MSRDVELFRQRMLEAQMALLSYGRRPYHTKSHEELIAELHQATKDPGLTPPRKKAYGYRVEPEGDPRWALVDLFLWTTVLLIVIVEAISVVGHWIFRRW